jgi:hypothetical protein
LDNFLARQAAIASGAYAPPSPPTDVAEESKTQYAGQVGLSTPQKPHGMPPHGYLTPPITPENEGFNPNAAAADMNKQTAITVCPSSPTPPNVSFTDTQMYDAEPVYVQYASASHVGYTTAF